MSTEAIVAAIPPQLFSAVCTAFADSQHHNASHRKNVHTLIRLHCECSKEGGDGERVFFLSFLHCLHHILNIRKCEELSNKLMRFLIGFIVRLSGEKTAAASRFIENALLYALDNLDAKDKAVRVRLCQIVVAGVNGVEEVSDAVWELLQTKMVARLYDKEPSVRVHAVHAMSRLQALMLKSEAGDCVLDIFKSLLTVDPVAEVRKAALVHIDVNTQTLDGILSRCRDVEPSIRRLFFSQKMLEIDIYNLSVEQRDYILTSGLTDRDESVVKTCIDMILSHWLPRTNSNIIGFLTSLDVVSNQEVAESALQSFFKVMPNIIDPRQESYLEHLTVEIAFVLRVYCEYVLKSSSSQVDPQEILPGLSKLSKTLTVYYEYLVAVNENETDKAEVEFILMELMTLCTSLDGADEVGRRECCQIAEEIMRNMSASEALFAKCSKLLFCFSDNLDDFVSRMLLISSDFHSVLVDHDSGDETIRIMAQLRAVSCLSMVLNASDDCNLTKYPILVNLLNELVIPAVNSQYAIVQSNGLECLGLFMLLSKDLSTEYQQLFLDFLQVNSGATRDTALKVLFDLVIVHGCLELCKQLSSSLYDPDQMVQSTAAEGFSKLLLHDKLTNDLDQVILGLLTLHYHPETKKNARLRQCLSFFFHAYAFGSTHHQQHIREVMCQAMINLQPINGINIGTLFSHLCYLCDPLNLVAQQPEQQESLPSFSKTVCELMYAGISLLSANSSAAGKFFICASKLPTAPSADTKEAADEQLLIKEAAYLTSLCMKNGPGDRHCIAALKKLHSSLTSADTGMYALTQDKLDAIRHKIHNLCPALLSLPSTNTLPPSQGHHQKRRTKVINTENIMDNLQDILE